MVRVLLFPGITTWGEKVAVAPGGKLSTLNVTGSLNPVYEPTSTVVCTVPSLHSETACGFRFNVKLGATGLTVMFVLLMSKKTLFQPFTITRPVVVVPTGTVMTAEPSLGVLSKSAVGYVNPPSVENRISTLAQLTGAAVVFATSQVMVSGT